MLKKILTLLIISLTLSFVSVHAADELSYFSKYFLQYEQSLMGKSIEDKKKTALNDISRMDKRILETTGTDRENALKVRAFLSFYIDKLNSSGTSNANEVADFFQKNGLSNGTVPVKEESKDNTGTKVATNNGNESPSYGFYILILLPFLLYWGYTAAKANNIDLSSIKAKLNNLTKGDGGTDERYKDETPVIHTVISPDIPIVEDESGYVEPTEPIGEGGNENEGPDVLIRPSESDERREELENKVQEKERLIEEERANSGKLSVEIERLNQESQELKTKTILFTKKSIDEQNLRLETYRQETISALSSLKESNLQELKEVKDRMDTILSILERAPIPPTVVPNLPILPQVPLEVEIPTSVDISGEPLDLERENKPLLTDTVIENNTVEPIVPTEPNEEGDGGIEIEPTVVPDVPFTDAIDEVNSFDTTIEPKDSGGMDYLDLLGSPDVDENSSPKVVEVDIVESEVEKPVETIEPIKIDEAPVVIADPDNVYAVEYDILANSDKNVFITGKAGAGKSTLLRKFLSENPELPVIVLAPTGTAALNVDGQTIHRFFEIHKGKILSKENADVLRNTKLIVIDEISMVRADLLDNMDEKMRYVLENDKPFGGVRMVFIGDLYQLPPVVTREDGKRFEGGEYDSPFFFSAHVYEKANFEIISLKHVFRQKDQTFISVLNNIRVGKFTDTDLDILNERVGKRGNDKSVYITTSNAIADEINEKRLSSLDGKAKKFHASIGGKFPKDSYPTAEELVLKEGCRVICVKNDKELRWSNGSMGTLLKISDDYLTIDFDNGKRYEVPKEVWEAKKVIFNETKHGFENKTLGTFTQFPVKVGYGMTSHRSQGKTFDDVLIDTGKGMFAHGQCYVALSRCTSLEGTKLKNPILPKDIIVDERVVAFMGD